MNQMQKSTSHDLEIRDFVNDCHILHKISISIIKKLNYFIITNNFTTEILNGIVNEIESLSNLFEHMLQLQSEIHPHLYLNYKNSIQIFHYEIWMQRIMKQLDILIFMMKKIIYKFLKFYTKEFLFTSVRLIKFCNMLVMINVSITADVKYMVSSTPNFMQENKKRITLSKILKIIAKERTTECANTFVQHLVRKYNEMESVNYAFTDTGSDIEDEIPQNNGDDAELESDNTSILVYKTLTQYASTPPRSPSITSINSKIATADVIHDTEMSHLVLAERNRLVVLFTAILSNPQEFLSEQEIKITKTGYIKIHSKVKQKLTEMYEQLLWQNVGIISEHMLLWWTEFGLGRKNPLISQKFNTWLKQYFTNENIHTIIQPTVHSLIDCLCCYITSTSWDELFTQALISANCQHSRHDIQNIGLGTKTGHLFSDMLYDIVFLTNNCEGSNWTVQDLENLPLVEQIPLLHRLDHSIHSARMWALGRAKYLTNSWNMEQFFRVTHVDVNALLYALNQLKLAQNVHLLENENSHFVVCSKMRTKLVSEVNANIKKLQELPNQSLSILASVCKITSLAYLKILFPPNVYWQQKYERNPKMASEYVEKYLDEILRPVLLASQNLPLPIQKSVSKLVLEILCEAWLDHIYKFRIKFSEWGAIQLLIDFAAIPIWIREKVTVSSDLTLFLTTDEILRRCEGVGRLLLRQPGESITMSDENKNGAKGITESQETDNAVETLMPPEMYVPNQEKWLELRLNQQKSSSLMCC